MAFFQLKGMSLSTCFNYRQPVKAFSDTNSQGLCPDFCHGTKRKLAWEHSFTQPFRQLPVTVLVSFECAWRRGRRGFGQCTVSACSWTCGSLCRTRFITDPIAWVILCVCVCVWCGVCVCGVCVGGRNIRIMHKDAIISKYCYIAVPTQVTLIGISLNNVNIVAFDWLYEDRDWIRDISRAALCQYWGL